MADSARGRTASASSWSRVLPDGTGRRQRSAASTSTTASSTRSSRRGIRPLINLFHWDLPQALQDRGGFANPEVVGRFADYAGLVASRLGDRVSRTG